MKLWRQSQQGLQVVFKVARWLMLTALLASLLPVLLSFLLGILILVPKGRVWSNYWGHTLAEGTRAVWHWVFGPPKVRVHQARSWTGPRRGRPSNHWRN